MPEHPLLVVIAKEDFYVNAPADQNIAMFFQMELPTSPVKVGLRIILMTQDMRGDWLATYTWVSISAVIAQDTFNNITIYLPLWPSG